MKLTGAGDELFDTVGGGVEDVACGDWESLQPPRATIVADNNNILRAAEEMAFMVFLLYSGAALQTSKHP